LSGVDEWANDEWASDEWASDEWEFEDWWLLGSTAQSRAIHLEIDVVERGSDCLNRVESSGLQRPIAIV